MEEAGITLILLIDKLIVEKKRNLSIQNQRIDRFFSYVQMLDKRTLMD